MFAATSHLSRPISATIEDWIKGISRIERITLFFLESMASRGPSSGRWLREASICPNAWQMWSSEG